ncbi:hypothetical protein ABK040_002664 [Willaertia magna]
MNQFQDQRVINSNNTCKKKKQNRSNRGMHDKTMLQQTKSEGISFYSPKKNFEMENDINSNIHDPKTKKPSKNKYVNKEVFATASLGSSINSNNTTASSPPLLQQQFPSSSFLINIFQNMPNNNNNVLVNNNSNNNTNPQQYLGTASSNNNTPVLLQQQSNNNSANNNLNNNIPLFQKNPVITSSQFLSSSSPSQLQPFFNNNNSVPVLVNNNSNMVNNNMNQSTFSTVPTIGAINNQQQFRQSPSHQSSSSSSSSSTNTNINQINQNCENNTSSFNGIPTSISNNSLDNLLLETVKNLSAIKSQQQQVTNIPTTGTTTIATVPNNIPSNNVLITNQQQPLVVNRIKKDNIHRNYSLNNGLLKRMTIDMYFDIISAGHPYLPKQELESLETNEKHLGNLSFMFSLQALCYQRFGFFKQANDSFQKAKQLLSSASFDEWNQFNIACTYCNLSLYCGAEGNEEGAKFYSNAVDFYIKDYSFKQKQNPEQLKALIQMKKISDISFENGYVGDETNLNDVSKFLLAVYQYATSSEREIPNEILNIARKDINEQTLTQYLSLLDCVMKMMFIYESKGEHFSKTQQKLTKFIYFTLFNGMKILILKKVYLKNNLEIEQCAERITMLTRLPIFSFAPSFLVEPVALATNIHLELIKEIENGERDNSQEFSITRLLRKDLEALTFLKTRFHKVAKKYKELMEEAENVINQRSKLLSQYLESNESVFQFEEIEKSNERKRKTTNEDNVMSSVNNNTKKKMSTIDFSAINSQPPQIEPLISRDVLLQNVNNQHNTSSTTSEQQNINPDFFISDEDFQLLFGDSDLFA